MRTLTVAALVDDLDRLLSGRYPAILVEGEVSQIQRPASGHAYVVLRDKPGAGRPDVKLNVMVWRDDFQRMAVAPVVGDRVVCRGKLRFYGPGGTAQLYATEIVPAGQGALAKAIAERKARLMAEGLLDPRRKRPLPPVPRFVGVATSLTGAAIADFLVVSRRRWPAARILVAGCQVQGVEAPSSVIRAIELLVDDGRAEVIVVTRGGGSKEDLIGFQDEALARYVAQCPIPVVSAVGHQIDTTLCDLVADVIAPTPSAAAMAVLPEAVRYAQRVDERVDALVAAARAGLAARRARLEALRARLRDPAARVTEGRRRLEELRARIAAAGARVGATKRTKIDALAGRLAPAAQAKAARAARALGAVAPRLVPATHARLAAARRRAGVADRLPGLVERRLAAVRARLGRLDASLVALSPLAVLDRGYAILRHGPRVVTAPDDVAAGDRLEARLRGGTLALRVDGATGAGDGTQLSLLGRR